ncbi:MAG: hypothetical protein SFV19_05285, partial [Rhodospirillaceae bacterium]|nr:hypothetical protein [Rhodospirillaceae bacterium]
AGEGGVNMKLHATYLLMSLASASAVLAQTSPPPENTGANVNIVREVVGKLAFRALADGRDRGHEDFRLVAYADGSRQIYISKDFKAVNAQQTMIARVDARFRPLETYATYWTRDGFQGAIFVTVTGNQLHASVNGPQGRRVHSQKVPDHIVVVHHGETMNGWYMWPDFAAPTSGPQTMNNYNINGAPRDGGQVKGVYHTGTYARVGPETITTPAGTFDTVHYQLSGQVEPLDLWVGTEDKLLIRQTDTKNGREYILVELKTATPK